MMTAEEALAQIEQLRKKDIPTLDITKDAFLTFRHVLVQQPDFKHFRGTAQHGGRVSYEYTDNPRS